MAKPSKSSMSSTNNTLASLLAVMAVASAIPLASARASWWLIWSAILCATMLIWLAQSYRLSPKRRLQSSEYRLWLGLAAIVPLYAFVQSFLWPQGFIGTPFALYVGDTTLASQAISVQPGASWIGALRFIGWILLFVLVVEVATNRNRMLHMTWILFIGIFLQALWALLALRILGDIALFGEKTTYLGSATGTFVNRNSLATFLGFGLLVGAGLLAGRMGEPSIRQSRLPNLLERLGTSGFLIVIGMLTIFLALIATQSRLGLFASLIALFVTILLLLKQNNRLTPSGLLLAGGAFMIVLILALLLGQGGLAERLIFVEGAGLERQEIYRQTLAMTMNRPLTGFGFDAFGPAFESFRTAELGAPYFYDLAHNSYLTLWAEQGFIIGSLPPLLLLIAAILLLRRTKENKDFTAASITAFGAILLGAIHSLGDFSLEIPANVFVFVLILGLGLSRRHHRQIEA